MNWLRRVLWIGGLLVIFVAGIVVGSAGTARFLQKRYEERVNPDNWEPRTMNWLTTELELTPQQQDQVRPAVQAAVAELVQLRDRIDNERRATLHQMLQQILPHLKPAQKEKLQDMTRGGRPWKQPGVPAGQPTEK